MNTAQNLVVAAGSIAALPFYRCHKEVQACQILRIDEIDIKYWLVPCSTKLQPFEITAAYIAKHSPQPGGYYLRYTDGYESFSPAEPFESGYALLPDPCSAPSMDPQPVTAMEWNEERNLEHLRADCLRMAINTGAGDNAVQRAVKFMDFIRPPDAPLPSEPVKAEGVVLSADHAYRKKPVVIEAFQLTPETRASNENWPHWAHEAWNSGTLRPHPGDKEGKHASPLIINTLEGSMEASIGDFIIRGVKGELYPCKPDIFATSYEAASDADSVPTDLLAEHRQLRASLLKFVDVDTPKELAEMEEAVRLLPIPSNEKANLVEAIAAIRSVPLR